MSISSLKVAWVSDFPLEWLPDAPEELKRLPKDHSATWMSVLMAEFQKDPSLEIHVMALRKQLQRDIEFSLGNVHFHVSKVPRGVRTPSLFWADTWLIGRKLRSIKPDLVHAWGTERGSALIASRLPYPYLVTMQGLLNWYKELIPIHGYERIATFLETIALRRAHVVTTESCFAIKYLSEHYPHLLLHQAEHASNWHFHRIERKPQTQPIRFISVGTVNFRKGSDLIFRALDHLTPELPFELVIIGSGGEIFEGMRKQLSPEFIKRIQFKSGLRSDQVAEEYSKATIKLMPTRADTSPNAVKEAVVAGLPVVGSRIGGIPDYVFPGQNGLIFESEDLDGFIRCIRDATKHPLFGRGEVDPECLKKTREYLSPLRMRHRFREAYELVLQEAAKRK